MQKQKFFKWLAGILDGDGNFDLRKNPNQEKKNIYPYILKTIRIKFHQRDIRVLTRIQNFLHYGKIRIDKKKPYVIYDVSKRIEMMHLINNINGFIRIKVESFEKACFFLNIIPIKANYRLEALDPYFSGLVDTDGSIVFNFSGNRIECNVELKFNQYTEQLNFDDVIPYIKPYILLREKKNQTPGMKFKSIAFKYQNVKGMESLYNYFMLNRLYSDFKFYRITQIKKFLQIRGYAKYPYDSPEFKIYSAFVFNWIKYKNPTWTKVLFISKLNIAKP